MKHKQQDQQQFEYEFFGPCGPVVLVFALPCVVLGLVYACNSEGCVQLSQLFQLPLSQWDLSLLPGFPSDQPLYSHEAMAAVVAWFVLVLLLHVLLPGEEAQGVLLPTGRRLTYKLNGESESSIKLVAHVYPFAYRAGSAVQVLCSSSLGSHRLC